MTGLTEMHSHKRHVDFQILFCFSCFFCSVAIDASHPIFDLMFSLESYAATIFQIGQRERLIKVFIISSYHVKLKSTVPIIDLAGLRTKKSIA